MLLILIFSAYVFISEKGLKKGGAYLAAFLGVGAVIGIVSSYSNDLGKYLAIFIILLLGFIWNYKKNKS